MTLTVVTSVADEERVLDVCPACANPWRLVSEKLYPLDGRWVDALVVRCSRCGVLRRALFDITSFYDAPAQVWARWPES
jgi:predicted Zn finger-like uncharacterized protein